VRHQFSARDGRSDDARSWGPEKRVNAGRSPIAEVGRTPPCVCLMRTGTSIPAAGSAWDFEHLADITTRDWPERGIAAVVDIRPSSPTEWADSGERQIKACAAGSDETHECRRSASSYARASQWIQSKQIGCGPRRRHLGGLPPIQRARSWESTTRLSGPDEGRPAFASPR